MANLYIERQLHFSNEPIAEGDCFKVGEVVVVLAEPGAGKSELLTNLAKRFGTRPLRASAFRHSTAPLIGSVLVIDALDEVARQDDSAFDQVIVKASESHAETVILSARSDVWPSPRTAFVKECFGKEPKTLFLKPFNEEEQRRLFEAHFPSEDFETFFQAVDEIGLVPLLGNPMFLKLFVEGYLQLERKFTSKAEVFRQAVTRLAGGDKKTVGSGKATSTAQVIQKATELFAKLLLSGASGISTVEHLGLQDFPYLPEFSQTGTELLKEVINTRLFVPGDTPDQHTPVHRIVAEYCAAQYLSKRVDGVSDPFSLARCLALVAPNSVIREDLRGLVGWMAALGGKEIQKTLINLDAYSILANGDPALLLPSSKATLLTKLKDLADKDPYFRRLDRWRRFSVAGFFDASTVPFMREVLVSADEDSHLKQLLLELLHGSQIVPELTDQLRAILLDANSDWWAREHARQLLVSSPGYDHSADAEQLVAHNSSDSFRLVARFQTQHPTRLLSRSCTLSLLEFAGSEGFVVKSDRGQKVDLKLSLDALISTLPAEEVEVHIDALTAKLKCNCGANRTNMCSCKRRRSKVVGKLLDQLLKVSTCTADRLWGWMKTLNFYSHGGAPSSFAVKALEGNSDLRRSIQALAFSDLTDRSAIWDMLVILRWGNLHAGLAFTRDDIQFHATAACENNNIALWSQLIWRHDPYSKRSEEDQLIQLWKSHARKKPEFMREWSKLNRGWRQSFRKDRKTYRGGRKWQRSDQDAKARNHTILQSDRSQIESGRRWWWTDHFSHYFLHFPEKMGELDDGKGTAERTLYNSFEPLMEHLPSIQELSAGEKQNVARMLHASAIVHFRKHGNFDHWPEEALLVLETEVSGAKAYLEGEVEKLERVIDERIFKSSLDIEAFSRSWFESRLQKRHDPLWQFRHKECYAPVRGFLASEWLEKHPTASFETTKTLFTICAQEGDHDFLRNLIERRCDELLLPDSIQTEEYGDRKKFWFVCHLFFASSDPQGIWPQLLALPNAVFLLERRVGRWDRDQQAGWPKLDADKIFRALEALVPKWPKVFLPDSWGTGSPEGETAYRFLCDLVWRIADDKPDKSIAVIDRMLGKLIFADFEAPLKSMRASAVSKFALLDFRVPNFSDVVDCLDHSHIVTVEDMRARLIEELDLLQSWLKGSETNPLSVFWPGGKRVDENTARNRVVEWLTPKFKALDSAMVIEHHMANDKRCDFTVSKQQNGRSMLLVCEAKGQWHADIFTAVQLQLDRQYTIHPDAAKQGVYLAFWFGQQVAVAGKTTHSILSAAALKSKIEDTIPSQLRTLIDVYVLDVSQP